MKADEGSRVPRWVLQLGVCYVLLRIRLLQKCERNFEHDFYGKSTNEYEPRLTRGCRVITKVHAVDGRAVFALQPSSTA